MDEAEIKVDWLGYKEVGRRDNKSLFLGRDTLLPLLERKKICTEMERLWRT